MGRCLIDMDGVVADFIEGICRLHGRPDPYASGELVGPEYWDINKTWGMSEADFWGPAGYDFWYGLKPFPHAKDLVDFALELFDGNVCFLSSPVRTAGCMDGKKDWCHKHFHGIPLLLSVKSMECEVAPKEFCAHETSVLVDDLDKNIDAFDAAGGRGILFPQPWNTKHGQRHESLAIVFGSMAFHKNAMESL